MTPASSARIRRLVITLLVAIVIIPATIVVTVEWLARDGRAEIADATEAAAREAAAAPPDQLAAIAARHEVRLWRIDPATRRTLADSDRQPRDRSDLGLSSIGSLAYEPRVIDRGDAERPAAADREHAIRAAELGASSGCATRTDDQLLVCEAAVRTAGGEVVLAQRAAPRVTSRLADAREGLLVLGGTILIVGGVLAGWLVRRLTGPLAALERQVAARARGEQRAIEISHAPREIAEVAGAVDALAGALEDRRRHDAEAAADLAHELKGPLARIKVALEAEGIEPAARAPLEGAALRAVATIDRVLVDLLEIARVEAGQLAEPRAPTDLRALAGAVIADRPPPDGIAVELRGEATRTVAPEAIARALGQLVENAYAHARSQVTIELGDRVRVRDDGPGVPDDLRPRLFERFASRRPGGTGLGLAFVRAVAEAHGGAARYRDGAFELELP